MLTKTSTRALAPEGSSGGAPAGGSAADDKDHVAKIEADLKAAKDQTDKLLADAKKRENDDALALKAKKDAAETDREKLLREKSTELDAVKEQLAGLREIEAKRLADETKRIEALLAKLDKDTQGRLNKYKERTDAYVWFEMVTDAYAEHVDADDKAPPGGAGGGKGGNVGGHKLHPKSKEVLSGIYHNGADHERVAANMFVTQVRDEDTGVISTRFGHDNRKFFDSIKRYVPENRREETDRGARK